MATKNSGLYKLLSFPKLYTFFQDFLGGVAARKTVVEQYIRPMPGNRILDIGCGPADFLKYFPDDVYYEGFDMNPRYIEAAKTRYGRRGNFYCQLVEQQMLGGRVPFDLVIATGLLHHLEDCAALQLLKVASSALKLGGRLITTDGCFIPGQSFIAKHIIALDRGDHVRLVQDYENLAKQVFPVVKSHIRHDLLRISYTHLIMECYL